jgi:hypothetical protein
MCTYVTATTPIAGSGLLADGWTSLGDAVVYFDHPVDAPDDHALCIDLRGRSGDPAERIAVELDAASARRLAETILAILDDPEVVPLLD